MASGKTIRQMTAALRLKPVCLALLLGPLPALAVEFTDPPELIANPSGRVPLAAVIEFASD